MRFDKVSYAPLKDVVASLDSGYTVLMGGIANVNKYLGDPVYDKRCLMITQD